MAAKKKPEQEAGQDRIEEYEAVNSDGEVVTVVHNIETGETHVK